ATFIPNHPKRIEARLRDYEIKRLVRPPAGVERERGRAQIGKAVSGNDLVPVVTTNTKTKHARRQVEVRANLHRDVIAAIGTTIQTRNQRILREVTVGAARTVLRIVDDQINDVG